MGVATAIAAVGAAASAYGGKRQRDAAGRAADTQDAAAMQANRLQRDMYEQTREDYTPYREVGYGALGQLANFYGIDAPSMVNGQFDAEAMGQARDLRDRRRQVMDRMWGNSRRNRLAQIGFVGPESDIDFAALTPEQIQAAGFGNQGRRWLTELGDIDRQLAAMNQQQETAPGATSGQPTDRFAMFRESPDYQFNLEEMERALGRQQAARGNYLSGGAMRELSRYTDGLSNQHLNQQLNRLSALAGVGQTATDSVSGFGANAAQGRGNALMNAGAARASGYIGGANARNDMYNNIAGFAGMAAGGFGGGWGGGNPYQDAMDVGMDWT